MIAQNENDGKKCRCRPPRPTHVPLRLRALGVDVNGKTQPRYASVSGTAAVVALSSRGGRLHDRPSESDWRVTHQALWMLS